MWSTSLLFCVMLQSGETALVQELLARIESLQRRVAELEQEREPRPSPTSSAAAPHAAFATAAEQVDTGQPQYPSLRMSGFTDINFSAATDQKGNHSGFSEGQFTMHLVSALAPKVNFFGEVTLTARPDAGIGAPPATGFNAEVERSIIRFDQSDMFKVSFGRYHTPINWWNTSFHHGQWLQTTVSRPEMVQFGGRFIPVHFVGALVEGTVPARGLNLSYNAGLGNGRGPVISRAGDAGDSDNNRAWLANISARPDAVYGLQFGGAVYQDRINVADDLGFREWITSAHVVWNR